MDRISKPMAYSFQDHPVVCPILLGWASLSGCFGELTSEWWLNMTRWSDFAVSLVRLRAAGKFFSKIQLGLPLCLVNPSHMISGKSSTPLTLQQNYLHIIDSSHCSKEMSIVEYSAYHSGTVIECAKHWIIKDRVSNWFIWCGVLQEPIKPHTVCYL